MFLGLQALDGAILLWIQEFVRGFFDPVVIFYTHLGDKGLLWIGLSLILLCYKPTRKAGMCALLGLILSLICTNMVLKHLVGRTRPWLDVAGLVAIIIEGDPNSFPSGHTSCAFAAAVAWWLTLPNKRAGAAGLVLAALMGLSRLYVGVHYPSDVIAGAIVGAFCGWAAWKLVEKIPRMNRRTEDKG